MSAENFNASIHQLCDNQIGIILTRDQAKALFYTLDEHSAEYGVLPHLHGFEEQLYQTLKQSGAL